MNKEIRCYLRQLKSSLQCGFRTRKKLLAQFRHSLSTFLEENPNPTFEHLIASFGPPEEMADILMEEVTEAELRQYCHHRKLTQFLTGLTVILFILFSLYVLYLKEVTVISFEGELIPDTTIFSQEGE